MSRTTFAEYDETVLEHEQKIINHVSQLAVITAKDRNNVCKSELTNAGVRPSVIPAHAQSAHPRPAAATKKKEPGLSTRLLEGGDDLLSRFRSTIGAMKLNFSVRDGKRWILHAIITLMS